mmetsp:Transcript_24561/g.27320  ORF Transcript_24561/g.27320 Transcript_24561/m.27320 type:complete len:574 (-) Transcript_24561:48-1769(-)
MTATSNNFVIHNLDRTEQHLKSLWEDIRSKADNEKQQNTSTCSLKDFVSDMFDLLTQLFDEYFNQSWENIEGLVDANKAVRELANLNTKEAEHKQKSIDKKQVPTAEINEMIQNAQDKDDDDDSKVKHIVTSEDFKIVDKGRTLLLIHASYCEACKRLIPNFKAAAKLIADMPEIKVRFAMLEGSLPMTRNWALPALHYEEYPTLWMYKDGKLEDKFSGTDRSIEAIVNFAKRKSRDREKAKRHWEILRQKLVVDKYAKRSDDVLKTQKQLTKVFEISKALGCTKQNKCVVSPKRDLTVQKPRLYLMGGGMASGKSSVVRKLHKTDEFWMKYGKDIVIVEADRFKMKDPVFKELETIKDPLASYHVHEYSTQAASELFLVSLHHNRDIVLDGTMMWEPFVKQTIEMVRDNKNNYCRGPGYKKGEEEVYWKVERPAENPCLEYEIIIIGVTAPAETAVARGIVRKIVTTRGVPVYSQLESHRQFSVNFEGYVKSVDQAMLFYNGEKDPILIAHKEGKGKELEVLDKKRYKHFISKKDINSKAKSAAELFPQKDLESNIKACCPNLLKKVKAYFK